MVTANPTELTMVRAVPLLSVGADWATKVDNCGESAITAMPQSIIKAKKMLDGISKIKGESKQQQPEAAKAM